MDGKRSYAWVNGARFRADAEKVGTELEEAAQEGQLTAEALISFAASPDLELHKCFTWDDTEAARQWRLEESRYILRSIEIVIEREEDTEPIRVRGWLCDRRIEQGIGTYYALDRVLDDADVRTKVLRAAEWDLASARRHLTQLLSALDELNPVLEQLSLVETALHDIRSAQVPAEAAMI